MDDVLFLNTIGIMDELDEVVTKLRALLARERALLVEERASLVKERAVLEASKHAFQKEMADARRAFEAEKAEMVKIGARASDVIDLNVGGHAMSVLRSTLCAVDGSMLACMFSGRWEQQLVRDAQGRVFLDYNPYCFERIVDCLRDMALVDGNVLVPTVSVDLIPTMLTLVEYLGLDKIRKVMTPRWKEHAGVSVFDNGVMLADKEAHSAFAILHDAFQVGKHTWHVSMDSGGNTQVGVIPVNEVSSCYKSSSLFRMGFWKDSVRVLDVGPGVVYPTSRVSASTPQTSSCRTGQQQIAVSVTLDCDAKMVMFVKDNQLISTCSGLDMSKSWTLFCVPGSACVRLGL